MKILCIGCFHGKFPKGMKKFIKDNNIDAIFALGDYPGKRLRPYFNKYMDQCLTKKGYYSYEKLSNIIGERKYEKLALLDEKDTLKILNKLNKLQIPVYLVHGNHDRLNKDPYREKYRKEIKLDIVVKNYKNLVFLDYEILELEEISFGFYGSKYPNIGNDIKGKRKERLLKLRKHLRSFLNLLCKDKNSIIITHSPLYNTKIDVVVNPDTPRDGNHYGDDILRSVIEKKQPLMSINAHFHEHHRFDKIGKTKLVSCGYGHDGQGAILEINKGKKPKVKLVNVNN